MNVNGNAVQKELKFNLKNPIQGLQILSGKLTTCFCFAHSSSFSINPPSLSNTPSILAHLTPLAKVRRRILSIKYNIYYTVCHEEQILQCQHIKLRSLTNLMPCLHSSVYQGKD